MTTELVALQQELQIAKQQNEITLLRLELEKVQAQKSSRLEDSLFSPALYPHYEKVAQKLSESGVIPKNYIGKPNDIFVAIAMGYQLGFPVEQSLQDIAVINGRPCLWGDGLLALVLNHPDCQDIREEPIFTGQVVTGYTCTVIRRGHEPHTQAFTMKDAERAGLLGKPGPWTQYPTRMLQMRARSLALRDKFADALRGLRIAEIETDDTQVIEGVVVDADKGKTQTEKLKKRLQSSNGQENETMPGKDSSALAPENTDKSQGKKVYNTGDDGAPATEDQKNEIHFQMTEKGFDDARKKKALDYFKVAKLDDLTDAQARLFLLQLGKP